MKSLRWPFLIAVASFIAVMVFVRPIPQWQSYHDFADRRQLIPGIANTMDVLSNLPFLLVGLVGLSVMGRNPTFASRVEAVDAVVFFVGTILTSFGSAFYHLNPNDNTLVFDRLPMTVAFMSFVTLFVQEREPGLRWLLPIMLGIGIASIAWWVYRDDLRPYGWVQFFPVVAILFLIPAGRRYTGELSAILFIGLAYLVAKICEAYDKQIFDVLRGTISGHTLKHLAAAFAPLTAAWWIATRRILTPTSNRIAA